MNKKQVMLSLESISKELNVDVMQKLEDNNKFKAIEEIENIVNRLKILIYEIKRY